LIFNNKLQNISFYIIVFYCFLLVSYVYALMLYLQERQLENILAYHIDNREPMEKKYIVEDE